MFAHSKNVKINGGEFHFIYGAKPSETAQKGIELLQRKTAPGALHDSDERYDSPKCHPRTREAILQEIMDWIGDMDRQTRFLWLHGPAGAGKSAIEQTIAELCCKMNFLAASFFFSRSIGDRNKKTFLITTIVGQLIVSIPEIREHVGNALYNDPSLPTRSLEAQMDALVVKPLEAAASSRGVDFMNPRPRVIVLDGLDECGDPESQRYILKVLLKSVSNYSIPFSFIVASRPEQHIREAFDGKLLSSMTTRLVLDDKYHPDDDIRTFLQSKFQDIKNRHPSRGHLPSSWPSNEAIERLVQKSSGQFIYASTVIKFIDSHRHWPPDRLNIIFGISPCGKAMPFAEMDALYLHILTSASDNIETALEILAALLFLQHRDLQITPRFVESFLSLRKGEVFMILGDLHSVIAVPSADERELPLRLFHASLGDFLTDRSRSGDTFFLDSGVCHRNIINRIVKQRMNPVSSLMLVQKESLQALFPELCLKATPDPEFLSNLYDFDMSLCPHRPSMARGSYITQIFLEVFDSINSSSRVPEFLVWMQGQKHPAQKNDLFTHHLPSINIWLRTELSAIRITDVQLSCTSRHVMGITERLYTSATLVDFPQFRNIHHLIPRVLDLRPKHVADNNYHQIEDSEKWEIYVKYRKIVSQFLTDPTRHLYHDTLFPRGRTLFVGPNNYTNFASYLFRFLSEDLRKIKKYDADIPKAILIILPIVFSKAGRSVKLLRLLEAGSFNFDQLPRRFPQENWHQLFSSSYIACRRAVRMEDDDTLQGVDGDGPPPRSRGASSSPPASASALRGWKRRSAPVAPQRMSLVVVHKELSPVPVSSADDERGGGGLEEVDN